MSGPQNLRESAGELLLILNGPTFDHGYFRRMTSSMCDLPFFESLRHFSPDPANKMTRACASDCILMTLE
jgi:hypothetical protein